MREAAVAKTVPQQVEYAATNKTALVQNVKRVCALQATGATCATTNSKQYLSTNK